MPSTNLFFLADPRHTNVMWSGKEWGSEQNLVPSLHHAAFGGISHCATLDVRRRRTLESYF